MTIGQLEDLINNKPDNLSWEEWRAIEVEVIVYPSIDFTSYTPCEYNTGFVDDDNDPVFLILPQSDDDFDDDETEASSDFHPELN